jgi:hypothetical protein
MVKNTCSVRFTKLLTQILNAVVAVCTALPAAASCRLPRRRAAVTSACVHVRQLIGAALFVYGCVPRHGSVAWVVPNVPMHRRVSFSRTVCAVIRVGGRCVYGPWSRPHLTSSTRQPRPSTAATALAARSRLTPGAVDVVAHAVCTCW